MTTVEAKLDGTNAQATDTDEDTDAETVDAVHVDAQIAKVTTELAARLDASTATWESRMTSVESQLSGRTAYLESKLTSATGEIQENVSVTVAGVEEKLTAVQGDFNDMADAFAELGARVDAADASAGGADDEKLAAVSASVASLEEQMSTSQESLKAELSASIDLLAQTSVSEMEEKLTAVQSELAARTESCEATLTEKINSSVVDGMVSDASSKLTEQVEVLIAESAEVLESQIVQARSDLSTSFEEVASEAASSVDRKIADVRTELSSRMDTAVTAAVAMQPSAGQEAADGAADAAEASRASLYADAMRRSDELQTRVDALDTKLSSDLQTCSDRIDLLGQDSSYGELEKLLGERIESSVATLNAQMEDDRTQTAANIAASMRALRLLQRLDTRPDGADVFTELDTDGDGQIDREELRAGFKKMGEEVSDVDMETIMELVDIDGDGKIDAAEFMLVGQVTKDVEALHKRVDGLQQLSGTASTGTTGASAGGADDEKLAAVSASIASLEEQMSTSQESLKAELSASIETSVSKMEENMSVAVAGVEEKLIAVQSELTARTESCEATLTEKINSSVAELCTAATVDGMVADASSKLTEQVEVLIAESAEVLESRIVQARSDLSTGFAELNTRVDQEVSDLTSMLSASSAEAKAAVSVVASEAALSADRKIADARTEFRTELEAAAAAMPVPAVGTAEPTDAAGSYADAVRRSEELQSRFDGLQSVVAEDAQRHGSNVQSLSNSVSQVQSAVKEVQELLCQLESSSKATAFELNSDVVDLSERLEEVEGALGAGDDAPISDRLASIEADVAATMEAADSMRESAVGGLDADIDSSLGVLRDELALRQMQEVVAALAERQSALEQTATAAAAAAAEEGIPPRV